MHVWYIVKLTYQHIKAILQPLQILSQPVTSQSANNMVLIKISGMIQNDNLFT